MLLRLRRGVGFGGGLHFECVGLFGSRELGAVGLFGARVRGLAFARKEGKGEERRQRGEVELNRMVDIFSRCLEPPPREEPRVEAGVEEVGKRLAKEYTRRQWARHNAQQKDLGQKMRLKMEAVLALGSEWQQEQALLVREPLYPSHGRRAELFPPTAGFQQDRDLVQDPRMLEDSKFARMVKEQAALGQDVGEELLARASATRTEEDEDREMLEEEEETKIDDAAEALAEDEEEDDDDLVF